MYEKMQTMEREHDHIRKMLLCEPRGSVARHVNLIVPTTRPDCDVGVIIMEPTEYVPMSGSNTITTVTVLLETGIVPMIEPETIVKLDMPGGVVTATARCRNGKCESVQFQNVPCFAHQLDAQIEVEGVGKVSVDIAYGGMFFAIVDAYKLGFKVAPGEARALAELGEKIRLAAREQLDVVHPENPNIRGVTIVQFDQPYQGSGKVTRNTCIVSPGRSDRSPTGTGTSARMAVLHARGQMAVGDTLIHSSIIGSEFKGQIKAEASVGGRPAIIPTLEGQAWITGFHNYVLDASDPFPQGYVVSDTWGVTGKTTQ
jgi:proline racemase